MSEIEYGQKTMANVLRDEGVKAIFGIHGSFSMMVAECLQMGIKVYHVRHEQTAGYAADGYARCLRRPGIVFTSLINGFANTIPGILHAEGALSPVVFLAGSHSHLSDGLRVSQEGHPAELVASVGKWSHKIGNPHIIAFWLRKALRDSVLYPPGPVTLEVPAEIGHSRGTQDQLKYCDMNRVANIPGAAGDPVYVQKAVETLLRAKRPVIIAGDGIYWSDASAELVELAELLQVPVCTRRMARGALPENHPLSWTPSYRRGFLENADVVCVIGLQVTQLDLWFEPPDWPPQAKYLQIQERADDIWYPLPTETAVIGSSKLVLRQMIECARTLLKTIPSDRGTWVQALAAAKEKRRRNLQATVDGLRGTKPIHPHVLGTEIVNFLDPSGTMIYDSLTMSTFITDRIESRFAGQILDAGLYQTLGHSIGMAIGAQVARPGRQVVTVIGDGGFGIGVMDLETMAREKLPVVNILFNNSSWGGRAWGKDLWYAPWPAKDMLPDIRYDQMLEYYGCHGEFVTEDSQIRPALDRAFNSGRPSLINVIGDATSVIPFRAAGNLMEAWSRGPGVEYPEAARAEMKAWGLPMAQRAQSMMRGTIFGYNVPLREIADAAGIDLE